MTVVSYQSISVGYINGEFISASLFVSVDVDGKTVTEHFATIKDHRQAMESLRSIEKVAGHSASLKDYDSFVGKSRMHYTGKYISHSDILRG
jgi:hypothetical protein